MGTNGPHHVTPNRAISSLPGFISKKWLKLMPFAAYQRNAVSACLVIIALEFRSERLHPLNGVVCWDLRVFSSSIGFPQIRAIRGLFLFSASSTIPSAVSARYVLISINRFKWA